MKNIMIISLIAFLSFPIASCSKRNDPGQDRPPVSVGVGIVISAGGQNGGAPSSPSIPSGTSWVMYPIQINTSPLLFCYNLQPTEYFPLPLYLNSTQFNMGCISRDNKSTFNTQLASRGAAPGHWFLVTHIRLVCDNVAQEAIGFAPYRLMKNPKTGTEEWIEEFETPDGLKEVFVGTSRIWVPKEVQM